MMCEGPYIYRDWDIPVLLDLVPYYTYIDSIEEDEVEN
jgi:hypothetical protein